MIVKTAAITAIDMRLAFALVASFAAVNAWSWDGFDYNNGAIIEIQKGHKVRRGQEIEVFDYDRGEFIDVEVQSIKRHGRRVSIEVIDGDTGQERTFEMDAD